MHARALFAALTIAIGIAMGTGCGDGHADDLPGDTPGARAYSGELACKADSDCKTGEACQDGICQLKSCAGSNLITEAPLGKSGYLAVDREIVATTAEDSVQGYSAKDSTFARRGSTFIAPATIVDIAGGNLTGTRPDAVAIAVEGSNDVSIQQNAKPVATATMPFAPIALATGDTDGDGIDEIIGAAADGSIAVCKVQGTSATCTPHKGPGGIVDIAAGDVDGDGFAEVVALVGDKIHVINFDSAKTQQAEVLTFSTGKTMYRVAVGDLDGNGTDDVVGLEDGGSSYYVSTNADHVHLFTWKNDALSLVTSADVFKDTKDIAVERIDGKDSAALAVLGDTNTMRVLGFDGKALAQRYESTLSGASVATRLAGADVDGNSPRAKLRGTPRIVSGSVVPIAVLAFPPYSKSHSKGPSTVTLGSSETKGENHSDTVSLSAGVTIGAGFDLPLIFKANVSASIDKSIARTKSFSKSVSIGQSFDMTADPEADGFDSAAVVIACGCYQEFQYDVEDPAHMLGDGDGKPMSVFVPVGGQTSVWSLRRYNALADALGNLPKIKVPYKLGDVTSYPKQPQMLDGRPIAAADLVFPESKSFRVSDSAHVGFSLNVSDSSTNSEALSTTYSGSIGIGVGPVSANLHAGITFGTGYDVTVGKSTTFAGGVESIPNDPSTPEDEFSVNAYSFRPVVYRQRYMLDGKESAFYVMVYALGD